MDGSLRWQRVVKDLAREDQAAQAELQEIARWFPSIQMMRTHARGLIKVMTDDEKLRAMPSGPYGVVGVHPAKILQFAMGETRSDDPDQRARWWMYRSAKAPPQ